MVREVREETGYDVVLDGLLGVHVYYLPEPERINKGNGDLRFLRLVYRAHVVGGELRAETDGTTDEARWVPIDEVAGPGAGGTRRHRPRDAGRWLRRAEGSSRNPVSGSPSSHRVS